MANSVTPYFKIPIEKLLPKIPRKDGMKVDFNESQWAMVKGLQEKRFWVHIAARRTGKSYAAAILAVAKLLEPNQNVMVVAPNYKLSSIIWEYVTDIIRDLGIEVSRYSQKEYTVKFKHGSMFMLLSANKRDSLVGRAANLLIVDEAAVINDDTYFVNDLRPVLSTYKDSRCLFISTPRGQQNYLYEYFCRKDNPVKYPEWGSGLFPWTANPLLSVADIEEARQTMPGAIFRQEYECDWLSYEGQIFAVSEEKNSKDLHYIKAKDTRYRFFAGLDMGFRDATVYITLATDGKMFYVLDEFMTKESITSAVADLIREKMQEWDPESIFIDSAAQQTRADLAYDYDIFCENAHKDVNNGIAALQTLFEQGKLIIDRFKCPHTWKSVVAYRWNTKTEIQKPIHDWSCHACDALRYAIYTFQRNQPDIYIGN